MKQFVNQACVFAFAALAPLALVSTASAGFTNRSASSGTMTVAGLYDRDSDLEYVEQSSASGALPNSWANSNQPWVLEESAPVSYYPRPRLIFSTWREDSVAAYVESGWNDPELTPDPYRVDWSVSNVRLEFSVTSDDLCEITTQYFSGSFAASFWQQATPGGQWINKGMWGNLGATKVFAVQTGSTYQLSIGYANGSSSDFLYRMDLSGSGAPAPGALALIGMAGIFGGRRRRSGSRMDAQ